MHELGIAQGILDLVSDHVPAADAARVRDVRVRVGALSGVSADALAFGFEALAPSSPFPGARLLIERVPAIARCLQCGARSEADRPVLACPACTSPRVVLLDGAELQVVDITLADGAAPAAAEASP